MTATAQGDRAGRGEEKEEGEDAATDDMLSAATQLNENVSQLESPCLGILG